MFDKDGELLIFDSQGNLTTYTTTGGFQKIKLEIGPTKSAVLDENNGRVLISAGTKIYEYSLATKKISLFGEEVEEPTIIQPSQLDSTVWLFSKTGTKVVLKDGAQKEWSAGGESLDLIPFVFETYIPTNSSDGAISKAIHWIFILVCACIICGFLVGTRPKKTIRHKETPKQDQRIEKVPSTPSKPQESVATTVRQEPKIEAKPAVKAEQPVTKSGGSFTRQVEELIDKNLADKDFDVEVIAAIMGISRIHVNRKLKAEGSPSPSVLIKDKRMAKAKELLLQGETTVSQIAEICGFRSSSYFTTAFKEYTGLTPSEFSSLKRP